MQVKPVFNILIDIFNFFFTELYRKYDLASIVPIQIETSETTW